MLIQEMVKVEHCGKRVVTTAQLAEVYGVRKKRIQDNFSRAREYFKEGVHYFKLEGAALRQFKHEAKTLRLEEIARYPEKNGVAPIAPSTTCLYLWTYQGCARHCKMINSPQAWEVFDQLEKFYFECKGQKVPVPADVNAENEMLKKEMEMLKNQLPRREILELAVVYMLLMSNGSVKIGMTSNLTERIRQIQMETGLEVFDYRSTPFMPREDAAALEQSLHKKFSTQNIGGEFFNIKFVEAVKYLAA